MQSYISEEGEVKTLAGRVVKEKCGEGERERERGFGVRLNLNLWD